MLVLVVRGTDYSALDGAHQTSRQPSRRNLPGMTPHHRMEADCSPMLASGKATIMKIDALRCPACGATCHTEAELKEPFQCASCGSTLVLTDLISGDQVLCKGCGTVNRDSERFCLKCGGALKVSCPFCFAENSADARHCQQCGISLQEALQRKREWLAEKRQRDKERVETGRKAEDQAQQSRLQELLQDLDEPDRHPMAVYCLQRMGSRAVEPLIALLTDDDPDARYGAAMTLGQIGDARAIPALIKALADSEAAVRYWAADALGKLQAVDVVSALANLLADKHKGVRERAEQVLLQIDSPEAQRLFDSKRKRWGL